ncbi:MAG: hypothetical protein II551_02340 [Paludibacteraceae bacterium]|nr:hypothetical protein [Paludibacteraceae bacterium]
MKKILFACCLAVVVALPLFALNETVSVSAGSTETLPVAVSSALQDLADDAGLTLIGWTTAPVADGHRPDTYYGLGATVTPAVNTTYYALFAERAAIGELIARRTDSPADGDTLLLASIVGANCYLAPNSTPSPGDLWPLELVNPYYSVSLLTMTDMTAAQYRWIYVAQTDNKFWLQSAANVSYYLNATSSAVKCGSKGNKNMLYQNGFIYCVGASRYLSYDLYNFEPVWKPQSGIPSNHTFAFYRKERYVNFCTSVEASSATPCPGCFIFTR